MDTDQRTDHEGTDGFADGSNHTPSDDYDSPWKDIIHSAFPEFMAFFFADAAARIDWTAGHEFLDTELRQVVQDAELVEVEAVHSGRSRRIDRRALRASAVWRQEGV